MKQVYSGKTSCLSWRAMILGACVSCCALWLEYASFGNADFSDLPWLAVVMLLSCLIGGSFLANRPLPYTMWVPTGVLLWSCWRLYTWIFASRASWIMGVIAILTYPLRHVLNLELSSLVLWAESISILIISAVGGCWLYKNYRHSRLEKNSGWYGLFLIITVTTATYYSYGPFRQQCLGMNAFSSNLACEIRNRLGFVGTLWVTLIFCGWGIGHGIKYVQSHGRLSMLWPIVFEPLWIEMFFNPTGIVGVILLLKTRSLTGYDPIAQSLETSMRVLNLIPISVFFMVIPAGLFFLKSERSRGWWSIGMSAMAFVAIIGILFFALEIGKPIFLYPKAAIGVFLLTAIQLWLPIVIVYWHGRDVSISPT